MKKLILLISLISYGISAQEYFIYDSNGKLISTDPIEKKLIPDTYNHLPDGIYYLETKDPVFIDPNTGERFYNRCPYDKQTKKLELI